MTKLDAINRMLRYIGELPVPTSVNIADLSPDHEARVAELTLDEVLREEQYERYWFNRFTLNLTPLADGHITLPPNLLAFEDNSYFNEGGNLYEREGMVGIFENDVEITVRLQISFDDLPDTFRVYCIYTAAEKLAYQFNVDEMLIRKLREDKQIQALKVQRENIRQTKANLLTGSKLLNRSSTPTGLT